MSVESVRKNNDFVKRFRRNEARFITPEYIWHQRNEGKSLEQETTKPKKGSGKTISERARIAATVTFSKSLKLRSTDRQLRAYALMVADQIISRKRRARTA